MKNKNNLICILLKKSMFVALILFGPVALYAQVSNVVELTYSGSTISDAIQTSTFAPEVTETQADGVLELDIANLSDQDTMYTIEFANVVDISADPNMHVRIKSDSSMEYLGVKLVDDLGNFTTGNTNDDIIFLPGVEDKFLNYSFSAGSNTQATIQKELSAHNVDSTQIKKIIFFNNSGEAFTGKIWFNYFKLSTPDGDNGVELTDTTFYAPFNGERQFGNGLEGIAMDSKGRIGIAQDDALTISLNENLGEHKYLTVFIFETLLDLSNDNAEFHFQMKSDIEVTLLYRFEDVNGNRVDLVDMVPEVSDEMSTYRFDVNHRFTSNPDFDPTQIKEFHIRKLSSEGVNGTLVLDDFYLGIPYFDLYKNDYTGSTISDNLQTSSFDDAVTATQADGALALVATDLAVMDTLYRIQFDRPLDISQDPNLFARIKSNAPMADLGVKLVDINGNATSGTSKSAVMELPGVEDRFLTYSFSSGSNEQPSIQDELTANNVDSTKIKEVIFFNNSEAAFTGTVWFDYLQLSTPDTDNGAMLTDTTFYAPFNGERQFGNGIEAIAMDNNGRIGIYQNESLTISMRESLGQHSYLTVFAFDSLLDLSNDNAEFHFQMKSDIEVTLLYRFEDVNGKRVDLVDMVPVVSDEMSTYRFDVNHRFTSNPDFDPTQIKEFHIRKISSEGVNGTIVIDDFYLGIPYFDLYKNDYSGSTISDNLQTSFFNDAVTATQVDGVLALDVTDLAVMDTLYGIQFDRPLDISEDPNLFARLKSNVALGNLGVKLVDANGNATPGTSKAAVMELPGVEETFLTYSFSAGSNEQAGIQDELTANNVDSTQIKEVVFFNNSEVAFTGTIWFDYLQLSTPDTDNGAELTDSTFYAPFNGERQFGNGIEAIAMDNNGRIGIYQNETLTISMRESLGEHSYLTAFLFSDSLDVSNENSYVKFKMKSDIAVSLLLRYEDYNGERIDLVDFVPEVSDTFVTYAFSLNHRFLSNPGFKPEEVKEFHFRKLDTEPFNGTLVIDDFQIGFKDTEAPTAPSNLMLTEVTDTSATLTWEAASDEYGVFAYKVYANDELLGTTVGLQMSVDDLEGTVTFKVVASDRAGNDSEPSNEETATFEVTSINNLSDLDNLIKVFPNPAQEVIYIRCDQIKLQSVELISTAGSQVNIMKKDNSHNTYSIDLSALPEGMYIIKIQTEHGLITKPVIKE